MNTKKISASCALPIHIAVHSIGLIGIARGIADFIQKKLPLTLILNGVYEWPIVPQYTKFATLSHYGIGIAGMFVLAAATVTLWLRLNSSGKNVSFRLSWVVVYFPVAIVLNTALFVATGNRSVLFFLWFISFCAPLLYYCCWLSNLGQVEPLRRWEIWVISLFVIFVVTVIFWPLLFEDMRVKNDYMDIPEQTRLSNGEIVDNTTFINQFSIEGLNKYDPRKDAGLSPKPRPGYVAQVTWSTLLDLFINNHDRETPFKYYYDTQRKALVVRGRMTDDEYRALVAISNTVADRQAISHLFIHSTSAEKAQSKRRYTDKELEFLLKNAAELYGQIQLGRFFYHHSYYYGPMQALSLGANIGDVPILYGTGSTLWFSAVLKWLGQVNYHTYFKILFSFYPVYLVLLAGVAWLIFRRADYVLFIVLGGLISILILGPEPLRQSPGFNPIRHIFDIPAIYLYFRYRKDNSYLFLLAGILLAVLAIWWNKEFGLFLLLPLLAAEFVGMLIKRGINWKVVGIIAVTLASGFVASAFWPQAGKNLNFVYLLVGISLPETSHAYVAGILLAAIAGYFFLGGVFPASSTEREGEDNESWSLWFLSLALLLYCQALAIYPIWYPLGWHHFSVLIPYAFLFVATIARVAVKKFQFAPVESGLTRPAIATLMVLGIAPLTVLYFWQDYQYRKIFDTHVVHKWEFDSINIRTTMDPEPFRQAINLINRYTQGARVFMISKYDHLLPAMANKYNAMPFIELGGSLVTRKEVDIAVSTIRDENPEYIFVDTDIYRSLNGDILHPESYLGKLPGGYDMSRGRVMALSVLRKVFDDIALYYEPVERGMLVTVYRRKSG